jgi:hypothetical protein
MVWLKVAPSLCSAAIIVSYAELPGQQDTLVANAEEMTFNNLPVGMNSNVVFQPGANIFGTYDQIEVLNPDQYGGAHNSKYVQVTGSVHTSTLKLNSPIAYFGIWWSGGDPTNVLDFYIGSTLVAEFTTTYLFSQLPDPYRGNPTPEFEGLNLGEAFAYLNFFGQPGTTWDRIVITNDSRNGFESDNHALRVSPWKPAQEGAYPGVVFELVNCTTQTPITAEALAAPEPGTLRLLGLGCALLLCGSFRRRKTCLQGYNRRANAQRGPRLAISALADETDSTNRSRGFPQSALSARALPGTGARVRRSFPDRQTSGQDYWLHRHVP